MRNAIVRFLKAVLFYLEVEDPRLETARRLVREVEHKVALTGKDISGERKRSWVYKTLVTTYPDARKRDLGFLIEKALQETG